MTRQNAQTFDAQSFDAQVWASVIVAAAGLLFAAAVILEFGFDMTPCALCLSQRWLLGLAGLVAALGIAHNPNLVIYPILSGLSAAGGAWYSGKQLWLQSLPADQVPSCTRPVADLIDMGAWTDALAAMTQGTGNCAEIDRFLGVSLALWALLGFIAVFAVAIAQWRAGRQIR